MELTEKTVGRAGAHGAGGMRQNVTSRVMRIFSAKLSSDYITYHARNLRIIKVESDFFYKTIKLKIIAQTILIVVYK